MVRVQVVADVAALASPRTEGVELVLLHQKEACGVDGITEDRAQGASEIPSR